MCIIAQSKGSGTNFTCIDKAIITMRIFLHLHFEVIMVFGPSDGCDVRLCLASNCGEPYSLRRAKAAMIEGTRPGFPLDLLYVDNQLVA